MKDAEKNHKQPYAVVIGGANVDICGTPQRKLAMQDSNPGEITTSPGGVARNIAENLTLLGANCRLITAVGNDQNGKLLIEHGKSVGMDMDTVIVIEGERTSSYLSVLDADGDMLVAISDMDITERIKMEHLITHDELIKNSALIIVDTNLTGEIYSYVTERFGDKPLIVDTVSATKALRIKPYLSAIHTLKTNSIEASAISGIASEKLQEMAEWFHQQGVKFLLITLGSEGVFYSEKGARTLLVNSDPNNVVVNASGAGDAFVAGIAYAQLNDWVFSDAIKFAVAAATLAIKSGSTINPAMSLAAVNKIKEKKHGE